MLLEFRIRNFKSFRDEACLSMLSAPKQKGLDYSLFDVEGSRRKALCSSVIYGANASGKTNLVAALDVFRSIVLQGSIDDFPPSSPGSAAGLLGLIPNKDSGRGEPVEFQVDFRTGGRRIQYGLKIDLGLFLETGHPRRIEEEQLLVDGKPVFLRRKALRLGSLKGIPCNADLSTPQRRSEVEALGQASLTPRELFLTNGFKILMSRDLARLIMDWFRHGLTIVYRTGPADRSAPPPDHPGARPFAEADMLEAARIFGAAGNGLAFAPPGKDAPARLYSLVGTPDRKEPARIPARLFESCGTLRFLEIFPAVLGALLRGGVLVADEFDASIHPMALMNIIAIFHDDRLNSGQGQLIFNTHNPIFLNHNLFRRDEIKFVERDEHGQASVLYSLADFGTGGDQGVRKGEDYLRNYFTSRYGAIRDIDFTPVVEKAKAEALNDRIPQKTL